MTGRQRLTLVELPLGAPVILAGIRTAAVWTIGTATLATTIGQPSLGDLIFSGPADRGLAAGAGRLRRGRGAGAVWRMALLALGRNRAGASARGRSGARAWRCSSWQRLATFAGPFRARRRRTARSWSGPRISPSNISSPS